MDCLTRPWASFGNYFSNRPQGNISDGLLSGKLNVKAGVSQGTMLEHLLFSICGEQQNCNILVFSKCAHSNVTLLNTYTRTILVCQRGEKQ